MESEPLTEPGEDRATWKTAPGMMNRVIAGRYEILEEVGTGQLLSSFRARDRALNRVVVLKTLLPEYRENTALADQLEDGLSQVLSLSHPRIVRSYDSGVDQGSDHLFYLVEEYVRGVDLADRLRRVSSFTLAAANDVAIALAQALEFAHERGIAHGDLRPENILVSPEGQVKLTGFGTFGALSLVRQLFRGRFLMANGYTPLASGWVVPSVSADLYSVGVILFEMLTGESPFKGRAVEPRVLTPSPRSVNAAVPRALEGIVLKTMSAVPEERYASAAELLLDLRTVEDALRHGKSLAWSPLDATGVAGGRRLTDDDDGTVVAPGYLRPPSDDETLVMPLQTPPAVRRAAPPAPAEERIQMPVSREENRRSTRSSMNRWLTALNLFLFILVLGGLGALAWMTSNTLRPVGVVVVPNLVGKSVSDAESLAAQEHFTLARIDSTWRDKEPANTIYQMQPLPGRQIREGKPIQIWISKGPKTVEVPDLRDVSVEKARRLLEARGLRLGSVSKEFDALMAKGNVLRQKPDFGENKPLGTRIDLVLSNGEMPQEQPVSPPPDVPVTSVAPPDNPSGVTENKSMTDTGTSGTKGNGSDTSDTSSSDTQVRFFDVKYQVPSDGKDHRIRIDVIDYNSDNAHTEYEEDRKPGDYVVEQVQGVGRRITIRLFDNDERRKDIKI